jgi:hypothetical protein
MEFEIRPGDDSGRLEEALETTFLTSESGAPYQQEDRVRWCDLGFEIKH